MSLFFTKKIDFNFLLKEEFESIKELIDAYNEGYGFKIIAKELKTTYTKIRTILKKIEKQNQIKLRTGRNIVTEKLKEFRKQKAIYENKNGTGFNNEEVQKKVKIKNSTTRGIQGFYWNKTFNKYCWLRSSWEYIYACWLDNKNIPWDIEVKSFYLSNGERYLPDFFIFSNDLINLKSIVEIKGFWDRKKHEELRKMIKEEVILINDIKPYIKEGSSLNKETNKWKKIRKLKELK